MQCYRPIIFILLVIKLCACDVSFKGDPGDLKDKGLDLSGYLNKDGVVKHRAKRFLSFPPSSTAQLSTKLTVPLFKEYNSYVQGTYKGFVTLQYTLPTDIVTLGRGLENRIADLLPTESTVSHDRVETYGALENAFHSVGMPGKDCLLKAICEVSEEGVPENFGLLGEITSMILTPTHSIDNVTSIALRDYSDAENHGRSKGSCGNTYKNCPLHLTELIASAVSVLHGDISTVNSIW